MAQSLNGAGVYESYETLTLREEVQPPSRHGCRRRRTSTMFVAGEGEFNVSEILAMGL